MSHGDAMHFPLTIPLQPSKLVIASILAAHAAAGWTLFHVPSLALLQPGVLWSPLRGVSLLLWCGVFGSLLLALPLAVLLRMGPATVGATFSIDREPSFAMVTSRFGADSRSTAACSRCTFSGRSSARSS